MRFCERFLTELAIGILHDLIYSCSSVQGSRNMLLVYIMQYKIQSKKCRSLKAMLHGTIFKAIFNANDDCTKDLHAATSFALNIALKIVPCHCNEL